MSGLTDAAAFVAALVAMEGVAWATHKFLMHGPLWAWHASHHEPGHGGLERNDLFALIFAGLASGLFWWGGQPGWHAAWWAAAGVTSYGVLYALLHDGLVHRRFPLPFRPKSGYLRRLVQAHHLHHRTRTRDGAVSYGFLLPPNVTQLRRRLGAGRRRME